MSISQRFKKILYKLDKNSTELANELDVTKSTITKSIHGDTLPSSKILIPLGEKLNININWLLLGKGNMFIDGKAPSVEDGTDENNNNEGEMERLKRENEQLREHLKDKEEIIQLLKVGKS